MDNSKANIDKYIDRFQRYQRMLEEIRSAIKEARGARETIKYAIPFAQW